MNRNIRTKAIIGTYIQTKVTYDLILDQFNGLTNIFFVYLTSYIFPCSYVLLQNKKAWQ